MNINIEKNLKNKLLQLGTAFSAKNERIHMVGGAIRDIIADNESYDLDFTTSANPGMIRKITSPMAVNIYDVSRAKGHGTLGMKLKNGLDIEITPYRRLAAPEIEGDGAAGRHTAGEPVTLHSDLASRDFTINAMAMDIAPDTFGQIEDPCGGAADLKNGVLKTPAAVPLDTLRDDPLRTLRAVRFSIMFGLAPDAGLVAAIDDVVNNTDWLSRVAPERVRVELEKLLLLDEPSRGVRLMREWGLAEYWLPELERLWRLEPAPGATHKDLFYHTLTVLDRAAGYGPKTARFRFAALAHDIGKTESRRMTDNGYEFHEHEKTGTELAAEICRRLRFSNEDTEYVAALVRKHHRVSAYAPEWTDSAVRRAVHDLGGWYDDILALTRADVTTGFPDKREALESRLDDFRARVAKIELDHVLDPRPPIDGKEVMRLLGIGPGPDVGRAVQLLKDMIVEGSLGPDDAETARRLVKEKFKLK